MKTKTKTWAPTLSVCMIMSLFCVNAHSVVKECGIKVDSIEKNILITNGLLK